VWAGTTTRTGGYSRAPFDSLNLAGHVADVDEAVQANRRLLVGDLSLPGQPQWLAQCHSTRVVKVPFKGITQADAAYTCEPDRICAVLTADCLPVLLCDRDATVVAAIHAGWRGLLAGIIARTVEILPVQRQHLLAWLGPAIGVVHYQVGEEVYRQFVDVHPDYCHCFRQMADGWYLDMAAAGEVALQAVGVRQVYHSGLCTYAHGEYFFSYRRDATTGRMASLIYIARACEPT